MYPFFPEFEHPCPDDRPDHLAWPPFTMDLAILWQMADVQACVRHRLENDLAVCPPIDSFVFTRDEHH